MCTVEERERESKMFMGQGISRSVPWEFDVAAVYQIISFYVTVFVRGYR